MRPVSDVQFQIRDPLSDFSGCVVALAACGLSEPLAFASSGDPVDDQIHASRVQRPVSTL